MGWEAIVLSSEFTASESEQAVTAYETQAECDADETGSHAPRITW